MKKLSSIIAVVLFSYVYIAADDLSKIIRTDGVGQAKLGMRFEEFILYIDHDSIKVDKDGLYLLKKDKVILTICDKNYNNDKIVRMITIYSKSYFTKSGVHVGMSIKEFLKLYPKEKLYSDPDEGSCFIPMQLQSKIKKEPIFFFVYVVSNKGKQLIENDTLMPNEGVSNFHKDGYIWQIKYGYWN